MARSSLVGQLKVIRHVDLDLLEQIRSLPCIICGEGPADACHVKTKGSGGDDYEWNLYAGCRKHHTEQGARGWGWMFQRYPNFRRYIANKGWDIVEMKGGLVKLYHPEARY